MKIGGAVFDFNGTLFQDTDKHEAAWQTIAREEFGRSLSGADFASMHGRMNADLLEYLAGKALSPKEAARIDERKESIYRSLCLADWQSMHLTPGATQLLDELLKQGIPRAIATASGKANVDFYIQQFDLLRWFRPWHIVFNDGTVSGKPAPDLFLRAMAAIDIAPRRCLVFEDSLQGLEAAVNAGAGAVIAIGPREAHQALAAVCGVDGVITTFENFDQGLLAQ